MKTVFKRSAALTIAVLILGLAQAQAASTCYVYLTAPCFSAGANKYYAPFQHFKDTDGIAILNAGRCLERAQEYKSWCQTPGLEVQVNFQVDGRPLIGASTASNGKTYINDGIARYTRFHD